MRAEIQYPRSDTAMSLAPSSLIDKPDNPPKRGSVDFKMNPFRKISLPTSFLGGSLVSNGTSMASTVIGPNARGELVLRLHENTRRSSASAKPAKMPKNANRSTGGAIFLAPTGGKSTEQTALLQARSMPAGKKNPRRQETRKQAAPRRYRETQRYCLIQWQAPPRGLRQAPIPRRGKCRSIPSPSSPIER